jgi:hypothetical protein
MSSTEERIVELERLVRTLFRQIDTLNNRVSSLETKQMPVIVEMSPGSLGATQKNLSDLKIPGSPIPRHPTPYDSNAQ